MKKTEILTIELYKITKKQILDILNNECCWRHGWEMIPKYIFTNRDNVTTTDYYHQFISEHDNLNEHYYVFNVNHKSYLLEFEWKDVYDGEKELYELLCNIDLERHAQPFEKKSLFNELHVLIDITYEGEGEDCDVILEFNKVI